VEPHAEVHSGWIPVDFIGQCEITP
jgi:hypothetical protein